MWCAVRLPRACGDGPTTVEGLYASGQASPRMRGWTRAVGGVAVDSAGFPAHAGMDRSRDMDKARTTPPTAVPSTRQGGQFSCRPGVSFLMSLDTDLRPIPLSAYTIDQ